MCYWLANRTLSNSHFRALAESLYNCNELSPRVHGLLIGLLVLAIVRILLKVFWYRRCSARQDQGKKGLNLWLDAIPLIAATVIFYYYDRGCR